MSVYWSRELEQRLDRARHYTHLWWVGREVLRRMPTPVVAVSGPISTGGFGSIDENCRAFELAIRYLEGRGHIVFNPLPFQDKMIEFIKKFQINNPGVYDMRLLERFYGPFFDSGLVGAVYFLPGWRKSTGASWERERVKLRKIPMFRFPSRAFSTIKDRIQRSA